MSDGSRTSRMRRTSVWLEERTESRRRATGSGQTEGLDREKITAAAVRLLDTEGLAKFSMRRLAARLGVTAMSVYWYVDRKDDLLSNWRWTPWRGSWRCRTRTLRGRTGGSSCGSPPTRCAGCCTVIRGRRGRWAAS